MAALATGAGLRPPRPLPETAPGRLFSAGRAAALLGRLEGDLGPHPVGSAENERLRGRIEESLRSLGLEPQVQRQVVCRPTRSVCAVVENILARIEGARPGRAVMVSTHYDSVPAGPGVSDAGVSVAATLEIARALLGDPAAPRPVILFIGDGEEAGLLGARAFVAHHPWAREVGAVVNMEARGDAGRSWMFETSDHGGWLVRAYARSVPHPATASVAYAVYRRMPTDTDLTVYKAAGFQGLGLAFIGRVQHYHTPLDDLDNLPEGSLQQQGEAALALVRELRGEDLDHPPAFDAVFFDLLGLTTLWWTAGWARALAEFAAGLGMLAAWRLARTGSATWRGMAWGGVAFAAAAALAAIAGIGAALVLGAAGALPSGWPASAWASVGAAWAAGAAGALLAAAIPGARAGSGGLRGATCLGWAALAVGLTLADPAVGYLALLPAVALSGASLARPAWSHPGAGRWGVAVDCAAAAAGSLALLQIALVLFEALGRVALPMISVLAGLLVTLAWPPLGGARAGTRRLFAALAAGAAAALIVTAILLPPFTSTLPGRMNLRYYEDADAREALWVLEGTGPLPRSLEAAVGGGATRRQVLPWGWHARSAPAPLAELPPPEAVAATSPSGKGGAEADLHVRSLRGAHQLALVLPRGSRTVSVRYPGLDPEPVGEGAPFEGGRWRIWRFLDIPPDGIDVGVARQAGAERGGWIADSSPGLPPAGDPLRDSRPPWLVPVQDGDLSVVYRVLDPGMVSGP